MLHILLDIVQTCTNMFQIAINISTDNNWGKLEQAPPYDLVIRNGSMVTVSEMETIIACATTLWNMVPCFIIKQTQAEMARLITYRPPTVLLDNGSSMFIMKQILTETVMTILRADCLTVLLENGSMFHNQTNTDRNSNPSRECFPMFPWSKWLAQMTLAEIQRNRSTHRVHTTTRKGTVHG